MRRAMPGRMPGRMPGQRPADGFTLVELVITLNIVAILLRIAIPAYDAIRRESIASAAAGDLNAVRAAAVAQYAATGSYSPDAQPGTIPAGMGPFLPATFSFTRPRYTLDWENDLVNDPATGTSGQVLALTVTANDAMVGREVLHMLGSNCAHWSVGNSHTFVLQSTLDAPR